MTFLELCQMTARQTGTIQSPPAGTALPTTVVGQIHRLQQIVEFVREAYNDIQNAHRMWRWLNSYFTGSTIALQNSYVGTAFNDEVSATPITRFSQWGFKGDGSDIGLSIYLTATGPAEEGPLRPLSWSRFYETQLRGVQTPDRPQFYSVDNANNLVLSPKPDAVYTLRGKYRKSMQSLAADADIPEMPLEFHTLIKDAALQYVEGFDEGPRIPIVRLRMLPNFSMLEAHQLPKVAWGGAIGLMPIEIQTSLMTGGLDLASPPIAIKPGGVISASNYEPDIGGYTSLGGYERLDGHPRPSDSTDPTEIATRRAAISAVPGTGPVRGVWVFSGDIYAFRDIDASYAGMYKASSGGWVLQTFGYTMPFAVGTDEFIEGGYLVGGTSAASARIERVILSDGAWSGTADGYLVLSNITGVFVSGEIVTGSLGGSAVGQVTTAITLAAGGKYDFTNHNFYGAARNAHMYLASGVSVAHEWSGSFMTPIHTAVTASSASTFTYLLAYNGDFIVGLDGSSVIVAATGDSPTFVSHFKNYLFLGYSNGTLLHSSLGEPLEFISTTGAGEISFGDQITGLLTAASTSLLIFAQNRIDYLTGSDATEFILQPISEASGAQPYTAQMMDTPMFLDDGGVRSLPTTAAFGDWSMGTVTQPAEKLIRQKRDEGVDAVTSMRIKGKNQYRLFWEDGTGITVYIGRKYPETLPFKLPIEVFCACAGEVENGRGDRLFVGCQDGFVYEMNRGTSFDGAEIPAYIRLPFTAANPSQQTRWMKATFEIDSPDDVSFGLAFHTDYARGLGGALTTVNVDAGTAIISTDAYASIDWTQPIEGRLEYHLAGIGPNIAATLVTETAIARQHTISSQTYNFSRRGLKR